MPLRFIRVPRVNSRDVLYLATATTSLVKELSSISFFPPAIAAVSIVLLILETVQNVQTNKEACFRLARRCARILIDINDQMEGLWDSAPPTLIKNLERFQETLKSIYEFMKIQANLPWTHRFMNKTSTDNALIEYNAELEDAVQSFQIATLIDIHYTVFHSSDRKKIGNFNATLPPSSCDPDPGRGLTLPTETDRVSTIHESSVEIDNHNFSWPETRLAKGVYIEPPEGVTTDHIISDGVLEGHGFRRYHQSEVRLKGRTQLKDGWWSGASLAEIEGRPSLIKRYEGPRHESIKLWLRDVKLLQGIYHPSLPQIIGFSAEGAATPFILLSNVQTLTPQALLLKTLRNDGLAACAHLILRFYQDVVDATLYLQRQRELDDMGIQDFIDGATYRVDGSNTVIMGLPPLKNSWLTARSYGLTESLKGVVIGMLPKEETTNYKRIRDTSDENIARKISHLVTLTRGLLPADDAAITLPSWTKKLMGDGGDDEKLTYKPSLRQLRLSNIEAGTHNHAWHENGGIPSCKFSVGDFGYMPSVKSFNNFVKLGNILESGIAEFPVETSVHGTQWCWKDLPVRRIEIDSYPLMDDVKYWPIAVPPNTQIDCQITQSSAFMHVVDAWRFLLLNGQPIAQEHGIKPEEIILITRAGTNQDFNIRNICTLQHFNMDKTYQPSRPGQQSFGLPVFNNPPYHFPAQGNTLPTIMYLLTSPNPKYTPFWSHTPVSISPAALRPELRRGWVARIGWFEKYFYDESCVINPVQVNRIY